MIYSVEYISYSTGRTRGVIELPLIPPIGSMVQTPKYPDARCKVMSVDISLTGKIEVVVR